MKLKELLFTRGRIKLLSLVLAVVLWLFVQLEAGGEQEFKVRFEPVNANPELLVKFVPEELQVKLSGPRILLLRQDLLGLSAKIDLVKTGEGKEIIADPEQYIKHVHGVKVVHIAPKELQIILSKR